MQEVRRFIGHSNTVFVVAFSTDSRRAFSAGADGTLRVWDMATAQEQLLIKLDTTAPQGGRAVIAAFSGDGRLAVSSEFDENHARVWDLSNGNELHRLKGHQDIVVCLTLRQDGRFALSGSEDKTIRLWDVATGDELRRLEGHQDRVTAVAFSAGPFAVSAGDDKTVRVWNVDERRELRRFTIVGDARRVSFSPDSRQVLACTDKAAWVWDWDSQTEIHHFPENERDLIDSSFSPNALRALSGYSFGNNGKIRLWDTNTGSTLDQLARPEPVYAVAFSPDGRQALTGGMDKALTLWNLPP